MTDTRRIVKLYELNAELQWNAKEVGHVISEQYLEGTSLVVTSKADGYGSLLLGSKIHPDTAYQKEETLIIWSEGAHIALALSFREKAGCDEIWENICSVHSKDSSVDFTQEDLMDARGV